MRAIHFLIWSDQEVIIPVQDPLWLRAAWVGKGRQHALSALGTSASSKCSPVFHKFSKKNTALTYTVHRGTQYVNIIIVPLTFKLMSTVLFCKNLVHLSAKIHRNQSRNHLTKSLAGSAHLYFEWIDSVLRVAKHKINVRLFCAIN